MYFIRKSKLSNAVVSYTIEESKARLKEDKNIVLLDVRSNMERKSKSIPNSIHIPLHDLKRNTDSMKKYADKEIICYCQSGVRSLGAAYILKQKGFKSANMKGGIVAWMASEKNN